jgi:hypothetical protein
MTPAGKLQDYLKKRVQGSGGQYRKARWEGRVGCPDCFIWWEWPAVAWIEIKATNGRYKDRFGPMQAREVERMQRNGLPVYTAHTMDDIDWIVEQVRKGLASDACID